MGHRGYSGNHPRFSKRADERYDAKEAYNKDLTASARLHYLENVRHDHDSPANMHTDAHMRRQAKRIAKKTKGDAQDIYYEMKSKKMSEKKDSPMKMEGKGCAKSEGGSGCVVKRGDEYVILNNKKGGIFQSGFKSKQAAERSLAGYHANK
tara:strand:+ start:160 stop:612 length:453 start_codon:yes stop_codon:yes gene_type:complete